MTRRRTRALFAWLLLVLVPGAVVAGEGASPIAAVVEQPRAFGHVLGDVIEQRILLEARGQTVEPMALPPVKRINAWFERQRVRVEIDTALRRWLVVEYQLINAPREVRGVTLPAWSLSAAQPAGLVLAVPAWTLSAGPLTPPGAVSDLRPDRPPPRSDREQPMKLLQASLAALGATLAAWLGWWAWRSRRAAARRPFARAWRDMRGLDRGDPRAWQVLHRAFDETAGRVVQPATLPALFDSAPQLAELRERIDAFFEASSRLFFGAGTAADAVSPHDLCAQLRRIERRHEA